MQSALRELRRPALWAIAVVFGAITMMWTTYNEYVPDLLGNVFGVPALVVVLILTLDNVLAFFLEPLVGLVSDRTRTQWGKRLPWLMLALPVGAIAFALIPLPVQILTPDGGEAARQQAYSPFVFAVIGMITAMAITRTPTITLMPDLIAPPHRAVAHGLIQTLAGIGTLGALYSGTWLIERFGVSGPFWASSAVMIVSLAWLWLLLHRYETSEDVSSAPNGYSQGRLILVVMLLWMGYITVANRLAAGIGVDAVQDGFLQKVWLAAFTIGALPSGLVRDSASALRGGIVLLVLAIGVIPFAPDNSPVPSALMALGGAGWALVTVNSLPLLINAGPEERNGRNTGLYYLAFALAGLVTPWLLRSVAPAMGGASLWLAPAAWVLAWVAIGRPAPTQNPGSSMRH